MIRDPATLADIVSKWDTVKKFCQQSHRQALMPGGSFFCETPPSEFFNLPFILAYAVLDEVLDELMEQGVFTCRSNRPMLGTKMEAARTVLQWQNYSLVHEGKEARNDLAHDAKLATQADCFRFINAIEAELKNWQILA